MVERKHDQLSVFGIGKEESKEHWNSVMRQLLNLGYLSIKNWDYRSLGLTEKCHELLKGSKKVHLRKQIGTVAKKSKKPSASTSTSVKDSAATQHGRDDLFNALKGLRLGLAKEAKVPPYVIFSDKTLHEMCLLLPKNPSELLMVNGVGENKKEKYGDVFIKKIREFG
jgi:ATP-dependent DNA helicase RecQ